MRSIHTKLIAGISICSALAMNTASAQDVSTAVGYMEVIGKEFRNIQENTWDYTKSVAHGKSARKVEKRRKEVIDANKDALRKIKALKAFNGSTAFRDSAVSYLNTNYAVLNEDYAKLVDMEEVSEQSYDLMEAYMLAKERANEKLHASGDMIDEEYSKFAAANNINLIENKDKLSKNMEVANKVYKHYNEVYLIFFKSYKQEIYVMDALAKNDINGFEQNKNALAKTAAEGLKKLEAVVPYKNDQSVIKACQQMLNFYADEVVKMEAFTKFFVSKENYEKIKAAFDAIPEKDRKQQDVDKINKAGADYNKESASYNQVNQELNKKRSQTLDNWNNTCSKFTDTHIAKK
jgi:hypothetical protein